MLCKFYDQQGANNLYVTKATPLYRQSLGSSPQVKTLIGRPRNTWQRDTERETKGMGYTRREMERMATDRQHWRSFNDAYAPSEQTGIST